MNQQLFPNSRAGLRMELILVIVLVALIVVLPQIGSARREAALVRRLERIHDPNAAGCEVDAMIGQAKSESAVFERIRDHRF